MLLYMYMARYKVPQDVEADDKLLGPFSFRQFVYLLIAGGLIALSVGLFQIFPLLIIIPLPFILLFGALALPLKKDQPMETYLAALVSYYTKPRRRLWTPGQRESTIRITAPKIVEEERTRAITGEEATHRLSFLADIVDTEGYAIKGAGVNQLRDDFVAETNTTNDMFETSHFDDLGDTIVRDENQRHKEVIEEMKKTIEENEKISSGHGARIMGHTELNYEKPELESDVVIKPEPVYQPMARAVVKSGVVENTKSENEEKTENSETVAPKPSIIELANNDDFSVATIAKEANRIKQKEEEGEIFISLH